MLGEDLASKFELSGDVSEDKLGRHTIGRRLSDEQPIVVTVLDPQLKLGRSEVSSVPETSRELADLLLPGVLHCVEAGETEGGNMYLVTEAVDFGNLKALIRDENGLSPEDALSVAYRVAATLRSAAGLDIHHQDLSSSSIHADLSGDSPLVRVARYGFSHILPPYSPTRKNEPFYGTAEYMAPEVCSGRPADAAVDLYGLGILMYEMVAGKPPFVSSSPSTTIKRQVYEKPLPLHLVKPGTSNLEAYEKLVTNLLAKDPKVRPSDATEVMEAIAALKEETFPNVNLDLEPDREGPPEIKNLFSEESTKDADQGDAEATTDEGKPGDEDSRKTMVFTGLADQIARAGKAGESEQPDVDKDEEAASDEEESKSPKEAVSQPTEAFDSSMVREALKEASEKHGEGEADEQPGTGSESDDDEKKEKGAEDWFVEGSDELPESAFPEDEEEKNESRMFWVIVGAVAILVGVGVAVYFEGGRPPAPEPPKPIVVSPAPESVKPAEPASAPAPAPAANPEPTQPSAMATDPGPSEATAPDPGPPEPTPEELKAERLAALLADGQEAFEKGELDEARKIAEEIIAEDAEDNGAQELLTEIEATIEEQEAAEKRERRKKIRSRRKRAERPAAEPEPAKAKPAPKPRPAMSVEETQQKLRSLIRTGRDAYKRGDYETAISKYNKALSLDDDNMLVHKLLDQAKAKAQ